MTLNKLVSVPSKYLQIWDIYLYCFSGHELSFARKIGCEHILDNIGTVDLCAQSVIGFMNQLFLDLAEEILHYLL